MSVRLEQGSWREMLSVGGRDAYRLADMGLAKQLGAVLWIMGAAVTAALLPFAPPDKSALGDAGWIPAAAITVSGLVLALRLLRFADAVSPTELFAQSGMALIAVGLMMWLADDPSPYAELLLFSTIYVAAVHPPRRVLTFVLGLALVLATPLIYASGDSVLAQQVSRFLVWTSLAIVAVAFTSLVRFQRAGLRRRGDQARVEARADSLTGLGNRRAFDEAIAAATSRAERSGTPLSAIVVDLDSFKSINDRHGLVAGDRCLREVADALQATVRRPDSCFRWGGDEFVVLTDADGDGAEALARRLAKEAAGYCLLPDGGPVMLHTGIAQFGRDGTDGDALVTVASAALKPAGTRPGE